MYVDQYFTSLGVAAASGSYRYSYFAEHSAVHGPSMCDCGCVMVSGGTARLLTYLLGKSSDWGRELAAHVGMG